MKSAHVGTRNVRAGLLLIAVGLAVGLLMSLYAFVPMLPKVPASLDDYTDLPRRMIRLGHIAAIMLPLLNILFGLVIDRLELRYKLKSTASWLLIAGAALGPAALFVEAFSETARTLHLTAVPFTAFCVGTFILSWGALRDPAWVSAKSRRDIMDSP